MVIGPNRSPNGMDKSPGVTATSAVENRSYRNGETIIRQGESSQQATSKFLPCREVFSAA